MKRFVKPLRGLVFLSFCVLSGRPAMARELVIDSSFFPPSCDKLISVSDDETPVVAADFKRAVCLYSKLDRTSKDTDLRSLIDLLQTVQEKGALGETNSLAGLLESLVQCRLASLYKPALPTTTAAVTAHPPLFCASHRAAINAYNNVAWDHLDLVFAEGSQLNLGTLLNSWQACFADKGGTLGPLAPEYRPGCSILPEPPDLAGLVQRSYAEARLKYFGGSAPITAIFQRKQALAKKSLERGEAQKGVLTSLSNQLSTLVGKIEQVFVPLVEKPTGEMLSEYLDIYGKASAIKARVEAWKRGLFTDNENQGANLEATLQTMTSDLNKASAAYEGPQGLIERLKGLGPLVNDLRTRPAIEQENAQDLCRLYFCGLAAASPVSGAESPLQVACKGTASGNVLCQGTSGSLAYGSGSITIAQFCEKQSFPARYSKVGMTAAESRSCLGGFQTKKNLRDSYKETLKSDISWADLLVFLDSVEDGSQTLAAQQQEFVDWAKAIQDYTAAYKTQLAMTPGSGEQQRIYRFLRDGGTRLALLDQLNTTLNSLKAIYREVFGDNAPLDFLQTEYPLVVLGKKLDVIREQLETEFVEQQVAVIACSLGVL